jgi:hypothetical protein
MHHLTLAHFTAGSLCFICKVESWRSSAVFYGLVSWPGCSVWWSESSCLGKQSMNPCSLASGVCLQDCAVRKYSDAAVCLLCCSSWQCWQLT